MEKIEIELVKKLSKDLMLELNDQEVREVIEEGHLLMKSVAELQAIDCQGIEPMSYPFEEETQWLRDDVEDHRIDREQAFMNAPRHDDEYFEIVKVVQK